MGEVASPTHTPVLNLNDQALLVARVGHRYSVEARLRKHDAPNGPVQTEIAH